MQAFFANFPNKLALNFPHNIVHQIFHKMSNILYISRFQVNPDFLLDFPDFPDSPQIFQSMNFPQILRSCTGSRFSRFSILRKLTADSASSFPDFPLYRIRQIFRLPDFLPVRQQVKFSARKKALWNFPECHAVMRSP